MSNIHKEWLHNRVLHYQQRHEKFTENSVSDFACRRCYPIIEINQEIINEFLKFWGILLEAEKQIYEEGYTAKTIYSFGEILSYENEQLIKASVNLLWSISYKAPPRYELSGLIYIISKIKEHCYKNNDEGQLHFIDNKPQLLDEINNNCELQRYK